MTTTRTTTTIGVVMPTHGAGAHLAEAVESVVAQSLPDWTLVVVCDGSAPQATETAERLGARDRRIRVARQPHAGVAAARNRGLAELGREVELVALLDHDDRWLPHTLGTLLDALGTAPAGTVGAHGIGRFIDHCGAVTRPGELERDLRWRVGLQDGRLGDWPATRPTGFANLVVTSCIAVGTAVFRRAALDEIGGFDERAVPADDYDMWLRLSRLGDFAFLDQVVMEYRLHPSPTWDRPRGIGRGVPYVRRKIITSRHNTVAQADQARQGYRICETWIIEQSLTEARRLAAQRRYLASARQLVRAGIHAGSYLRGSPGPWYG